MPVYEFRCEECSEKVDLLLKSFDAAGEARCPACGAARLRRRFSLVAVAMSESSRLSDLSWIDRNARRRLEQKARTDSLVD